MDISGQSEEVDLEKTHRRTHLSLKWHNHHAAFINGHLICNCNAKLVDSSEEKSSLIVQQQSFLWNTSQVNGTHWLWLTYICARTLIKLHKMASSNYTDGKITLNPFSVWRMPGLKTVCSYFVSLSTCWNFNNIFSCVPKPFFYVGSPSVVSRRSVNLYCEEHKGLFNLFSINK